MKAVRKCSKRWKPFVSTSQRPLLQGNAFRKRFFSEILPNLYFYVRLKVGAPRTFSYDRGRVSGIRTQISIVASHLANFEGHPYRRRYRSRVKKTVYLIGR